MPLLFGLFCLVVNSSQNYPSVGNSNSRRHGRGGKRRKHQVDGNIPDIPSLSGSGPYRGSNPAAIRPNIPSVQHSSTSWPPPAASQTSGAPVMTSFPPGYMPMFPISSPFLMPQMGTDPSLQAGVPRFPMQGFPPVMPPVMTFMMPNYMFPQLGNPGPQLNPANFQLSGQMPTQMNPLGQFPCSIVQMNPGDQSFNPAIGQFNPLGSQMNPTMPAVIPQQFYHTNPPFIFPNSPSMPAGNANTTTHGQSRSSTPQSTGQQAGEREGAGSPLFQSRCSSPLNLLQLEELPSNRTDATQQTPPPGVGATQGGGMVVQNSSNRSNTKDAKLNNSVSIKNSFKLICFSLPSFLANFDLTYFSMKSMSPTRTPCRPPVTCWTYCCKRIPAQALALPPQALGRQGLGLGLGHSPLDQMGVAHLEVAQVSNLLMYATFLKS